MALDVTARQKWSSKFDFILTCVGYSVGLGNVWRFPYLCYRNGGGAFLIPYLLTVIFCGLPIASLEFSIGQYVGIGGLPFWEICPLFKGIGITVMLVNALISFYFIFITAMALYYAVASMTFTLPWMDCDNSWNTEQCHSQMYNSTSNSSLAYDPSVNNTLSTILLDDNITQHKPVSSAEEYMVHNVLQLSDGAHIIGSINWKLWVSLLGAWVIVYVLTIRGVKSLGKAVYFTSTFPYLMLTILFVRCLFLPGSLEGIYYFLLPQWDKLLQPEVWFNGMLQLFYSLGMGLGCFITMSSYNHFHSNCLRDAAIATLANSATSLYAGLTVFTVLGFMSHELGVPIDKIMQAGPGFAFIAYPRAMTTLPFPQVWSVCFFLMLVVLGISSQIVHFETVITFILDQYPVLRKTWKRMITALVITLLFLLVGTIFTTQGGMYTFLLMDMYSTPLGIICVAILECVIFAWIYGLDNLCGNINDMVGRYPNIYLRICWKYISPLFLVTILVINFARSGEFVYREYIYTPVVKSIGWCIALSMVLPIVVGIVYRVAMVCSSPDKHNTGNNTLKEKIKVLVTPSDAFHKHIQARMESIDEETDQKDLKLEYTSLNKSNEKNHDNIIEKEAVV